MRKFTLIELLVVVAIMGILTSILMPALSGAREKHKRAVCINNEKQIYLALLNYTSDDNDNFPTMHADPGAAGYAWSYDDLFSPYDGRNGMSTSDKNQWFFDPGHEQESKTALYRCPSDKRQGVSSMDKIARSYSFSIMWSIPSIAARGVTTSPWITDAEDQYSLSIGNITKPAQSIAFVDSALPQNTIGHLSGAGLVPGNLRDEVNNESYWSHDIKKTNFLFVDGHVQYMSYESTYADSGLTPWALDVRGTYWDCMK